MGIFELYLIFQADSIGSFLVFISIMSGLVAFCSIFFNFLFGDILEEKTDSLKKLIKYAAPVFCIAAPLAVLTPTTETLIAIYGIKEVSDFANNSEEMQKLPENVLKYMNTYLEKHTQENSE